MRRRVLKPGEFDAERIVGLFGFPLFFAASFLGVVVFPRVYPYLCRFRRWTGVPCPTCGASRAFLALLNGRILEAASIQPLLVILGLAYAGYAVYAGVVVFGRLPRLRFQGPIRLRLGILLATLILVGHWAYIVFRHGY